MIYFTSDPTSNPLNDFLVNYGIYIAIAVAGAAFLAVLILFIISLVKKKNVVNMPKTKNEPSTNSLEILEALGGKENIIEHSLNGSRMSLVLHNYDMVDENKLNSLGVDSCIKMSNKIILVIKNDMSSIYKGMFR